MTTDELILALKAADPTGEEQVCVSNAAILFVEKLPAYHDGPVQEIIKDQRGKIVSARLRRRGHKIRMFTVPLEELIMDDPDLPVELPSTEDDLSGQCAQTVECLRAEAREGRAQDSECEWNEDLDGFWATGCGEGFEFLNGGPDENAMKYCPYCGKKLKKVLIGNL